MLQLFAKILHNGSESGSVTLANQIHFLSTCTASVIHAYVRLIGQRHTSAFASVMQDLRKQLYLPRSIRYPFPRSLQGPRHYFFC